MALIAVFSGGLRVFQPLTLLCELPPCQLHCRGADLSESVCRTGWLVECVTDPHSSGTATSPGAAGAMGFLHLCSSRCPVYGAEGML